MVHGAIHLRQESPLLCNRRHKVEVALRRMIDLPFCANFSHLQNNW